MEKSVVTAGPIITYNWILIFLTIITFQGCQCLKLKVSVPQYTLSGETALLECQNDLDNSLLYSVKWSKDNEEFYSYIPKDKPSQKIFQTDGFKVDGQMSDKSQVLLKNVSLAASGFYECEISAEAPKFTSKTGRGHMEVFSLPKKDPEITGEQRMYQVGDEVNLNCTSDESHPPATLRWYVNDQQVDADYENAVEDHGLVSSVIGLRFQVEPYHFIQGRMEVKCISTIVTGQVVVERATPLFDDREALFLVRGGARNRISSLVAITLMLSAYLLFIT